MKRHARTAYEALKKMGAPVFTNVDCEGQYGPHFKLSGEQNYDWIWADYYGEFDSGYPTICPKVEAVLEKNGLFAEWENPGCVSVYDA